MQCLEHQNIPRCGKLKKFCNLYLYSIVQSEKKNYKHTERFGFVENS